MSGAAVAAPQFYVEIRGDSIDEDTVRRTIALELGEVEIPPNPERADETSHDVSLHIDVSADKDRLVVTMYDRGELIGRRTISAHGAPKLVARRVGLAVAELARDLRDRRLRLERELDAERRLAERRATAAAYRVQQEALGIVAGVSAQGYFKGAYLVGPTVGIEFNDHHPLRLVASAGWYAGGLTELGGAGVGNIPRWSKWEFTWGAQYVAPLRMRTELSFGAEFAASAVHLSGGGIVDQIPGQQDTWSAQAGLVVGVSRLPLSQLATRALLSFGRVLRPVPMSFGGQETQLGGFYLNGSLAVALFP